MVVLSQVLAADVNVGYEDIVNTQASGCFGCSAGSPSLRAMPDLYA